LKPEQCEIIIEKGVKQAYNLIRGVSKPYYGAYILNENKKIIIWQAEFINNKTISTIGIIQTLDGKQYLSFKDGTLHIKKYEEILIDGGFSQL